jgi:hypothetical protein
VIQTDTTSFRAQQLEGLRIRGDRVIPTKMITQPQRIELNLMKVWLTVDLIAGRVDYRPHTDRSSARK